MGNDDAPWLAGIDLVAQVVTALLAPCRLAVL
jgi:hypothetical protein